MTSAGAAASPFALEMRGVTKQFGNVTALAGVDLSVVSGRVHALLGENGAGKTTLMRLAYGLVPADAGEVLLFGARMTNHSVRGAVQAGVGMVHQHLSLVPNLTVAENVALGGRGRYAPQATEDLLERKSNESGLIVPTRALARDLSIVEQQRLEILKALARGARLLILDEPTALLAPTEVDELLRWIRTFAAGGGSVVIVTHKLREALSVADDVTVLRRGRVTYAGSATAISERTLAEAIFSEELERRTRSFAEAAGDVRVRGDRVAVSDARGARRVTNASFELRAHEIVGVAAVEASGHRELLEALAGLRPVSAGTLELPPRIAVIPADRGRDAMIGAFTLTENVALHAVGRRRGLMPWRELGHRTRGLLTRFEIVAPSEHSRAQDLSGGNQQRLVVARELEHAVDLVVADNPTRGLDMRATAFVHEQLRAAAAAGATVAVHSSDVDELLALASRVLVVFHGEVREVGCDRALIGRAMLGAA